MFFTLSKALAHFTSPLTIVVLMLILSVLIRNVRWRKILFWAGFSGLIFFSNKFIANALMTAWEVDARPIAALKHYKAAIVLTGSTIPGLEPHDRVYFQRGADRLIHTVQLYKTGYVEKIIISGGIGQVYERNVEPEADQFRKVMVLMGVPDSVIITESVTRNTAESGPAVKEILNELNVRDSDCLLITSAFHMRRSMAVYRNAGLQPDTFSTDFYGYKIRFELEDILIPKVEALVIWQKLMKEWVGILAYQIAGYV